MQLKSQEGEAGRLSPEAEFLPFDTTPSYGGAQGGGGVSRKDGSL